MLDTKALAAATAVIIREHVSAAVEPLLARIAALEARELVLPEKGEPGAPGRDGVDGKGVDAEAVRAMIDEMAQQAVGEQLPAAVKAAIDALPRPEKGERGEPGQSITGEPGRDGKDGVGLAGMMIDRVGEAVATLTDGTIVKLGPVVGRDGIDGEPGAPGLDGRDGQDLTDIQVTQDGPLVEFAFQIGETRSIYEIELPAGPAGEDGRDAYPGEARGLYDPAATYRAMDVVSHNGSEWRAKQDAPGELPGPGWMLSACKGKRGDRGERGLTGKDGTSPIAQYLRGSELVTTLSDGAELTADLGDLMRDEAHG